MNRGPVRPAVYLETTIISYLAARPSRDLIVAAHQQQTHMWWEQRRAAFEVYVSQLVLDEAAAGDPEAAERRATFLADLSLLDITPDVVRLAAHLVKTVPLPSRAGADGVHIAVAACHGTEFLLTWNCVHIANAELRPRVARACLQLGYAPPVLCTPDELMGGQGDG